MSKLIADRRLYLTADKTRVVEADDPKASFLLVAAGRRVPSGAVQRHGLTVKNGKIVVPPKPPSPPDGDGPAPEGTSSTDSLVGTRDFLELAERVDAQDERIVSIEERLTSLEEATTSPPASTSEGRGENGDGSGQQEGRTSDLPAGFPSRELLVEAGLDTIERVREASDEDLAAIKGIGDATVRDIRAALE